MSLLNEFTKAAQRLQLPYADEDSNFNNIDPELLIAIGQGCRNQGLVLMKTLEIPIGSTISRLCTYAAIKGAVPKASDTALALSVKPNPESFNIGCLKIVVIAGVATVLCWEINGLLRGLSYGSLEIAKD